MLLGAGGALGRIDTSAMRWYRPNQFRLSSPIAAWDPSLQRAVVVNQEVACELWLAPMPAWEQSSGATPATSWHFRGNSAALDTRRNRFWAYADQTSAVYRRDALPGAIWTLHYPGGFGAPVPRYAASAAYDSLGDRFWVYGGRGAGGALRPEIVALALSPVASWQYPTPAGTPPAARSHHAMTWDSRRHRLVVHGGYTDPLGSVVSGETWSLLLGDTPTWTRLDTTGTAPSLAGATLVYDAVGDLLLLHGGDDAARVRHAETWVMECGAEDAVWTRLETAGIQPAPRAYHGAFVDGPGRRLVVFGGVADASAWVLSLGPGGGWARLPDCGGVFGPREGHTVVTDTGRNQLLAFGGDDGTGPVPDLWHRRIGESIWFPLRVEGEAPPARTDHVAVYDAASNRMIVHGGAGATGLLDDTWALELSGAPRWTRLAPAGEGPSARRGHAAALDPSRGVMVLFGGDDGAARGDVWTLSLGAAPAWWPWEPLGAPPPPRSEHSLVWDTPRARLLLFGGRDGAQIYGDLWALTLPGVPAWVRLPEPSFHPEPRWGHVAVFHWPTQRMIVMGGMGGYGEPAARRDSWALSMGGGQIVWELPGPNVPHPDLPYPTARWNHAVGSTEPLGFDITGGRDGVPLTEEWMWHWEVETPVHLAAVNVGRDGEAAVLAWRVADAVDHAGFHVWRQEGTAARVRLTAAPLAPAESYEFRDDPAPAGAADYWLQELTRDGGESWFGPYPLAAAPAPAPGGLALAAGAPRADGTVALAFSLPRPGRARLALYDLRGRRVAALLDAELPAGRHAVAWDGRDGRGAPVASGVYCARLVAAEGIRVVKVTRVR